MVIVLYFLIKVDYGSVITNERNLHTLSTYLSRSRYSKQQSISKNFQTNLILDSFLYVCEPTIISQRTLTLERVEEREEGVECGRKRLNKPLLSQDVINGQT